MALRELTIELVQDMLDAYESHYSTSFSISNTKYIFDQLVMFNTTHEKVTPYVVDTVKFRKDDLTRYPIFVLNLVFQECKNSVRYVETRSIHCDANSVIHISTVSPAVYGMF